MLRSVVPQLQQQLLLEPFVVVKAPDVLVVRVPNCFHFADRVLDLLVIDVEEGDGDVSPDDVVPVDHVLERDGYPCGFVKPQEQNQLIVVGDPLERRDVGLHFRDVAVQEVSEEQS